MKLSMILTLSAALLGFILLWALYLASKRKNRPAYRQAAILTPNEMEFFGRLNVALKHLLVFPQLSMAAIIQPTSKIREKRLADFRAISQKRIDFVVCDRSLRVICVIELDDKMHDKAKDAKRDAILKSAGITTLRYESRDKPSESRITADVTALIGLATLPGVAA